MRSADYYFGRLIDYVSKFNNNTVVVLTGDHGARERPLYDASEGVTGSSVFSKSCVHKIFGNDNLFTTSGIVADLSGSILDPSVVGLTSKITADHDDLITTLKDILFEVAGTQPPPTSRNGNDLIAVMRKQMENDRGTYVSNKMSTSSTHLSLEIRYKN